MGPIIGTGFALATFDTFEMRRALWALLAGTLLGLLLCAAIVLLSPIQTVTSETASRTTPNLFDLLVALLAGLAGTYAMVRGRHPAASRVAEELAILAGVSPDQVLVDTAHKIVEVKATPVPEADLASYRELERRIGAAEPDWTIRLIPPVLSLPPIGDAETRDAALNTAIWAAQRLNLPVVLNGSGRMRTMRNRRFVQPGCRFSGRKPGAFRFAGRRQRRAASELRPIQGWTSEGEE